MIEQDFPSINLNFPSVLVNLNYFLSFDEKTPYSNSEKTHCFILNNMFLLSECH